MIKEFKIGSITWKINIDNEYTDSKNLMGECDLRGCEIKLSTKYKGVEVDKQIVEQTLYHEVVHAILGSMGEYKLSNKEKFVQNFSLLLHQFEKTKK